MNIKLFVTENLNCPICANKLQISADGTNTIIKNTFIEFHSYFGKSKIYFDTNKAYNYSGPNVYITKYCHNHFSDRLSLNLVKKKYYINDHYQSIFLGNFCYLKNLSNSQNTLVQISDKVIEIPKIDFYSSQNIIEKYKKLIAIS